MSGEPRWRREATHSRLHAKDSYLLEFSLVYIGGTHVRQTIVTFFIRKKKKISQTTFQFAIKGAKCNSRKIVSSFAIFLRTLLRFW